MRTTSKYIGLALVPLIVSVIIGACGQSPERPSVTAMTFNIRYANPDDGDHVWENRKDWVAEIIRDSEADVVGLQEALRHQIDTLSVRLTDYEWVGRGRSDELDGGEFSPIFFKTDRLRLVETSTFWLSSWPDSVGSVGWDAALPRVVTWASFEWKDTGSSFFQFNTHFDHRGERAREESARLIRKKIMEIAGGSPFIVTGDFNTSDSQSPYSILVANTPFAPILIDSRSAGVQSDLTTYRGFEVGAIKSGAIESGAIESRTIVSRTIDYIFHSESFRATMHKVLDESRDGAYPSDHLPVLVVLDRPDTQEMSG
ncbi:MAG: endonuclease/exonuclease/phosphatase family protein [Rhodothermia bacterium]|nr:MAG: endonuclease/exonuclease/phosphatase family protein [Rhodothermia bacterium]